MKNIIIVVPVYKRIVYSAELISLLQLKRVFAGYPISLIAPKSLDLSFYYSHGIQSAIRFDDSFFSNSASYSRLCLSSELYESFSSYDYILIYQLDAFVFSDRLAEFVDNGYDYIGAPVPDECWDSLPFHVGNGGFSLRKISTFLSILQKKNKLFRDFSEEFGEEIFKNIYEREDCFYAYCGYRQDIDFCVPDLNTAFMFSVEYNINGIYMDLENHLPFGCHRWQANRFDIWWPIIEKYGYTIDRSDYDYYSSLFPWHEYKTLMELLENDPINVEIKDDFHRLFDMGSVCLWGYGKEGRRIKKILNKYELNVEIILDRTGYDNDEILYPNCENIQKCALPILISTTLYDEQIANELTEMGKSSNQFFLWKSIAKEAISHTDIMLRGASLV